METFILNNFIKNLNNVTTTTTKKNKSYNYAKNGNAEYSSTYGQTGGDILH